MHFTSKLEMRLSLVQISSSFESAFHWLTPSLSDPAFHCPNLVLLRFSFPLSEPITSALVLFSFFRHTFAFLQIHEIKCNIHDIYSCMHALFQTTAFLKFILNSSASTEVGNS